MGGWAGRRRGLCPGGADSTRPPALSMRVRTMREGVVAVPAVLALAAFLEDDLVAPSCRRVPSHVRMPFGGGQAGQTGDVAFSRPTTRTIPACVFAHGEGECGIVGVWVWVWMWFGYLALEIHAAGTLVLRFKFKRLADAPKGRHTQLPIHKLWPFTHRHLAVPTLLGATRPKQAATAYQRNNQQSNQPASRGNVSFSSFTVLDAGTTYFCCYTPV